eukprot:TRINITY_DN67250_c0_g1_i1.p2 TRINITY_DN67250_c0_g1~~TRINITY_DN67250_c0_g1_i1.p2  ORF type:complete len:129 (+),score=4.96 TRINITY_DN67250_c0_g1_i1:119-505(+)
MLKIVNLPARMWVEFPAAEYKVQDVEIEPHACEAAMSIKNPASFVRRSCFILLRSQCESCPHLLEHVIAKKGLHFSCLDAIGIVDTRKTSSTSISNPLSYLPFWRARVPCHVIPNHTILSLSVLLVIL